MATKPTTVKKTTRKAAAPKADAAALSAPIYTAAGKENGSVSLPANMFGLDWNADLVHQVVTSMQANARTPVAHTKTRGEVRGGGRKPWKQKGTGRARHGSSRSPIWVGGGVAHGPRNDKSYAKKINRKARSKALFVALSRKFRDGEVIFVETLGITEPKTARAKSIMLALSKVKGFEALSRKRTNAALVATVATDRAVMKSFGNFRNVSVDAIGNLNPVSVFSSRFLVIAEPAAAIEALGKRTLTSK